MVPGLSANSSSGSDSSTSRTFSRQESNHPTSSSSSSPSPTTTASSDSETRERGDLSGIDFHPVPVSNSNVEEMIERGDPLFAANLGSAAKPTRNRKPNEEETTIGLGDPLFADSGRAPLSSEIPEWLQEFRQNPVDDRVSCTQRLTRQFFS